jgi:adenosine kinase
MSIIVTGSMAFDHIMDFPGYFKDHILPDKVHMLNVSFLVNSLKRQRGGCAANIAYNLALLQERPTIMATVGTDFGEYREWLENNGVDTSSLKVIDDEFTASAFVTTDKSDNQITGFYPGAMSYADQLSFRDLQAGAVDMAIISPNNPAAMAKYAVECSELGIPYIFDPGQQVVSLTPESLVDGARHAKVLIANDYEYEMIKNKCELGMADLCRMAEIVIVTLGEEGSEIRTNGDVVRIPPAKAHDVVDPTGAGDAYRAGVIKGLLRGYDLEKMGRVAGLTAVYALEKYGTSAHHFTLAEFEERYRENFGEAL